MRRSPILFPILLASIMGFGLALFGADQDDPAMELASFQVANGFEVQLFASEKDGVVKPIQIRFDPRGRLWVIGSTVYPQLEPGQTPNDKVLILEDTDHDGRADKTTVFADGLMIPTGLEVGQGGAYIGHGTELLFLKDTNGDGKADEREVLLRGFGTGDNHQNINSFLWGPGGELWMSQGLHIFSRVETPWGIARLEKAGIWRFRPRRLRLEGFYGSDYEPQNPWGFVFMDWGEPIVLAGNNSSPIYSVPGLIVNHRAEPPPLIWPTGQGRKVSGGDIVGTSHFPEGWQGALILGGYINNAIWAVKIRDDGAGFAFEDQPALLKSSSRSFRPVDVKFGPDGALYICDWYNPIIGHYQTSFRHPDRDKTHGRIWRVVATGRPLTKPPQLAGASAAQLLEFLDSPDRWTRHFAKRALADLPAETVTSALNSWLQRPGLSGRALQETLGVYQSHEVVSEELLARLSRHSEPGARASAASGVAAWADRLADPLGLLRPLVSDSHPRVRLHAVVACTYVPKPEAMEVAAVAVDFPTDKFIAYALKQAVFALKPYWLPAFKAGKLHLDHQLPRIGMLIRADGTPDTLEAVRALWKSGQLQPGSREVFLNLLAENGDAHDLTTILTLPDLSLKARLLPLLATAARVRNIRPAGDLSAALRPLIESPNPELRAEAFELAGVYKLEGFRFALASVAQDPQAGIRLRRSAIKGLSSLGGERSQQLLLGLGQQSPAPVQAAAIVALGEHDVGTAAALFAEHLKELIDPSELKEIISGFLQRQGGAGALAKALGTKTLPKQTAEVCLSFLSASGARHEPLFRLLAEAAGFDRIPHPQTAEEISLFAAEVRKNGNVKRGAEIFRRPELGCLACHSVYGEGGKIGPDLSTIGTAQPLEFIIGAILDPQKEVKEGYSSILVTTHDGGEYQGYQLRDTGEELVLRDVVQNSEVRVRRQAIKDKKQNGSVMPPALADTLTRAEFRDLVQFLGQLGKPQ